MTISDKLTQLNAAKQAIKTAIQNKGQDMAGVPFTNYANKIDAITGGTPPPSDPYNWTRPTDWLPYVEPAPGTKQIVLLYAVMPNDVANTAAFKVDVTGVSTYTVDWGDGTPEQTVSVNTAVSRNYVFAETPVGTTTSEGYRQRRITLTFTHNPNWLELQSSPITGRSMNFLEAVIRVPSMAYLYLSSTTYGTAPMMQHCNIIECASTVLTLSLANASSLKKVCWPNTTSFGSSALGSPFSNCVSMEYVQPINTTATVVSLSNTFQNCYSLKSVTITGNVSGVTSAITAFQNCSSLTSISIPPLTALTSMPSMFSGCASLESIPSEVLVNAGNFTSVSGAFQNCYKLKSLPAMDLSKVTGVNYLSFVNGCTSLQSVGALTINPAATGGSSFFSGCSSLREIPPMNCSGFTGFGSFFNTASGATIERSQMSGARFSHSYASNKLGQAQLVEIFNNLGTASGSQTITISGNPGASLLTSGERAIATGKGWTISG